MLRISYMYTWRVVLVIAVLLSFIIPASAQKKKDNTPLVDVFIGTEGNGHTYPGATLPYGMVQLSPVSRLKGPAYQYTDTLVYGFTHTRYNNTNSTEQNEILFMPTMGEAKFGMEDNRSVVDKQEEKALPGYYKTLLKNGIEAELTATIRAGMQLYDFPKTSKANIIIDLQYGGGVDNAWIQVVNNRELRGYRIAGNRHLYFYAKFPKPFKQYGISSDDVLLPGKSKAEGKNIKLYVQYDNPGEVIVKVGLSHVSADGALKNLDAEMPGFDFKAVQKAAKTVWINELAKIQVEGGAPGKSAMDIPASATNPRPKKAPPAPDYAFLKRTAFYTALYHTMLTPNIGGDFNGQYRLDSNRIATATGFNYYDVHGLSVTDNPVYQLLVLIDHKRTLDIIKSYSASLVTNGTKDIFVPLLADATTKGIKDTDTETIYSVFKSLAESMKKAKLSVKTETELNNFFNDPNRPDVFSSLPYCYNFTSSPQKTQVTLNNLLKRYTAASNGLPGNDNEGQLSGWYILSSLGLYEVSPAQQQYMIGLPQFDKAVITLPNDKKFTILNAGAGITRNNIYIQGLNLNGEGYNKLYLNYGDITKGGEFEVFTGTMANKLFLQGLEKPLLVE
ncbi:MAG: hypothetical protein EOP47_20490 [Sphingobacteriaceae bacterium]|nr:MAG: hypothetical protein EOP47_20490 [Sphingobacteriaceae bacterium]